MRRVILFVCIAALFSPFAANAQSGPVVWVASSLQRIGLADSAGSGLTADLSAARAEYESFQIVVRAPIGGLSNVDVTISDLVGPGGQVIPKSAFKLYREHYVYVSKSSPDWGGSNRPKGTGWYPDGLIPFNDPNSGAPLAGALLDAVPFTLSANTNQPIWVDLLVPAGAVPGQYLGSFTVSSLQGTVTGQISLRVWNFTLPKQPSMRSSFLLWSQTNDAAYKELLRNKIEPLRVEPTLQRNLIDNFGLGGVGLPFWSGADIGTCTMSAAPTVSQFQTSANAQQPDLMKYVYSADEIDQCPNLYDTMKQWGRNMHQAGLANLVTMSPTPYLYDDGSGTGRSAIDYWVMLPAMYDRARAYVNEVLNKGDHAWSYNTLVQDAYSPKWLIDFSPMDFRIQPGFINQSLGLSGLLYWRVDLWSSDPWNVINAYGAGNYPGEGVLLYPGAQVGIGGVAPSMRLKWLRDGIEDYEYIALLKQMGRGDWALSVSRTVGADWSNWTRNAAQLQSARQSLAAEIERLSGAVSPPSAPSNISPANGATGVSKTVTLAWSSAANATSYDVYFGTTSFPSYLGNVTSTSYSPANLSGGTTYYWRIDAKNSAGSASSATWSFTTAADVAPPPPPPPPVNSAPLAVSVTPSSGAGSSATFVMTFSDADGAGDITAQGVLINASVSGANACWISIDNGGKVWLANDLGSDWSSRAQSSPKPLSNSSCSFTPKDIRITKSGTNVVVSIPIRFNSTFAGTKNLFLNATDSARNNSGYQARGTWTVP